LSAPRPVLHYFGGCAESEGPETGGPEYGGITTVVWHRPWPTDGRLIYSQACRGYGYPWIYPCVDIKLKPFCKYVHGFYAGTPGN